MKTLIQRCQIFVSPYLIISTCSFNSGFSNSDLELASDIFIESDLPAMNSKDFLAKVKKEDELKNIPVIIFTAHLDPLLVEETKALGADNFILKPNRYSELKRILSTVIL